MQRMWGGEIKNINELKNNNNFYNEIIDYYVNSNFTYLQFNPYFNSIVEYLDDEDILQNDELDYCKNKCDIENDDECDNCKKKVTWRDYYNSKIEESKLKFYRNEECI